MSASQGLLLSRNELYPWTENISFPGLLFIKKEKRKKKDLVSRIIFCELLHEVFLYSNIIGRPTEEVFIDETSIVSHVCKSVC